MSYSPSDNRTYNLKLTMNELSVMADYVDRIAANMSPLKSKAFREKFSTLSREALGFAAARNSTPDWADKLPNNRLRALEQQMDAVLNFLHFDPEQVERWSGWREKK